MQVNDIKPISLYKLCHTPKDIQNNLQISHAQQRSLNSVWLLRRMLETVQTEAVLLLVLHDSTKLMINATMQRLTWNLNEQPF